MYFWSDARKSGRSYSAERSSFGQLRARYLPAESWADATL